ncbi:hypothetical protein AAFF_G00371550 [Aldrovandia affinis]|uniref:Uncharacterized protein n=1 Tax=Aldrovandia affinis TaxID=143900 RepID=A0AAD7SGU7_9TELE|nr:hypothetical protein AAFF_G00371550 [Aldrovandia affinis]
MCVRESKPFHWNRVSHTETGATLEDLSQKQTSLVAVAGAVIGAILALFLITVFTIVLLMACRSQPPIYSDKVIDLPPTHKPPPPYTERPAAIPLVVSHTQGTHPFPQAHRVDRRGEVTERVPMMGVACKDSRNPPRAAVLSRLDLPPQGGGPCLHQSPRTLCVINFKRYPGDHRILSPISKLREKD